MHLVAVDAPVGGVGVLPVLAAAADVDQALALLILLGVQQVVRLRAEAQLRPAAAAAAAAHGAGPGRSRAPEGGGTRWGREVAQGGRRVEGLKGGDAVSRCSGCRQCPRQSVALRPARPPAGVPFAGAPHAHLDAHRRCWPPSRQDLRPPGRPAHTRRQTRDWGGDLAESCCCVARGKPKDAHNGQGVLSRKEGQGAMLGLGCSSALHSCPDRISLAPP